MAGAQNHLDTVRAVYDALVAKRWVFKEPEGTFEVTKRVAWELRGQGYGLVKKVTGNQAFGYSHDLVVSPDGKGFDIISQDSAPHLSASIHWNQSCVLAPGYYAAPFDPDGPTVINTEPPSGGSSGGGGGRGGSGGGGTEPSGPVSANPEGYLLTPQLGLLEDDLAYRLSLLCVNVLQPLKDVYPNIVVVSGFRQTNSGIGQHELGEAVDLQVRNQSPELLYEIADYIQKNLNFDQLVLNFTNIGDGAGWIHVSFSAQSLRGQVLTKDFADTFHEGLFMVDPLTGENAAAALRDQAAMDADILTELQNIQTRQTRLGQRPTVIASAEADITAAESGTGGGGNDSGGSGSTGTAGTFQGPGFGLDDVTIMSSPDVRGWAVTTQITSLGMNPGTLHLEFDKQATWASVDIGSGPHDVVMQQATLWVFLSINGRWYCTGAERLRPNQQNKPASQRFSNWIAVDWLYDVARWGAMTGYRPAVGERVGFMVTQGSTRSDATWVVEERSDVIWITWPANGRAASFP